MLEGQDGVGKTTVAKQLCEKYNFDYIKFPTEIIKEAITDVKFSTRYDNWYDKEQVEKAYTLMHNLFDMDFRAFEYSPLTSRTFILDRYYPSNLVYYNYHSKYFESIKEPPERYSEHYFITMCIYFDSANPLRENFTNEGEYIDRNMLDIAYRKYLGQLKNDGKIGHLKEVVALQPDTFSKVEKILKEKKFI